MENTMIKETIEQRIRQLAHELRELEIAHLRLVQNKTREDQAFQQQAVQNQSRFAQIQGALTELKHLKQQGEYHAVSILDSIIHGGNAPAPGNPDRVSGLNCGDRGDSGADLCSGNVDHGVTDSATSQVGDRTGDNCPGNHLGN